MIYPASHYVATMDRIRESCAGIRSELQERLAEFRKANKLLEAQRLEQRTLYDLEMLETLGFCHGVENYSRWLDGRAPGQTPYTLYDYLPKNAMIVLDESHVSVPQIGGMYRGDRARKETLVEYGWRMPSALDNRPLRFDEWEERAGQRIYVSATPAAYELERCKGVVVEQIIRPTGLIDPKIEIRPANGQVDDLLAEIQTHVAKEERVLVTTLTKRMAEELTDYYAELGVRIRYLHSDIKTIERMEIIRELREGKFDVLVGINLLREGLDIPEVALVAILDADKEGFLRSARSLIQTIGRAARNVKGRVILYADVRDGIDPGDDRRDDPPPRPPGGLQRGARHHAEDDPEADHEPAVLDLGGGLRDRAEGRRTNGAGRPAARAAEADRTPAERDARSGAGPRVRARGGAARSHQGARGRAHQLAGRHERGRDRDVEPGGAGRAASDRARGLPLQERAGDASSTSGRRRISSPACGSTSPGGDGRIRIPALVKRAASVEVVVTGNVKEALLLENELIKQHRPPFNVRLRDDKQYLALRIDESDAWPRVTMVRRFRKDGAQYFGPYTSSVALKSSLSKLRRLFPLRSCTTASFNDYARRGRPCIEYEMKRCLGPCCGLTTKEAYAEQVRGTVLFLRGRSRELVEKIERRDGDGRRRGALRGRGAPARPDRRRSSARSRDSRS